MSIATCKELIRVLRPRYLHASRSDKTKILDEFILLTGYHRKHTIRIFNKPKSPNRIKQGKRRYYDDQEGSVLIKLWEASDYLCGKRLKALPILIDAMQRHGHSCLDPLVEQKLLQISAATIDKALIPIRQKANG